MRNNDCFLVVARSGADDIPVRTFTCLSEAKNYVDHSWIKDDETVTDESFRDVIAACKRFHFPQPSDIIGFDVCQFRNGVPFKWPYSTFIAMRLGKKEATECQTPE